MTGTTDRADVDSVPTPLSARLRSGSRVLHDEAQGTGYVDALLTGRLGRDGYAALVMQHFFIYEALEQATVAMADDAVAGAFVFPELTRLPALMADLALLCGPDWADRVEALPATTAYCARLRAVAFDRPSAFVAHHYTRYLGDLSGGQYLGRAVAQVYGFDDAGGRFFRFDGVDPAAFRTRYRALLDTVSFGPVEEEFFLAEVAEAYRLNIAVLHELGQRWT
jgi:heme oxygenase